jgi:hypothetical protein
MPPPRVVVDGKIRCNRCASMKPLDEFLTSKGKRLSYCVPCRKGFERDRTARLTENKLCLECGTAVAGSSKVCAGCKQRKHEKRLELIAAGVCPVCRNDKCAPRRRQCSSCLEKTRQRSVVRNSVRSEDGKCRQCSQPKSPNSRRYCEKCLEHIRWRELKRLYGLTREQVELLAERQAWRCAICQRPQTLEKRSFDNGSRFVVDHCHVTGAVRGLLCHHCNVGIGAFRDSPRLLRAATRYVEQASLIGAGDLIASNDGGQIQPAPEAASGSSQ